MSRMILMWTTNLTVGIKDFDEDHKRLIRMVNELHMATRDLDASGNMEQEELEIALHRLENYTKYHCSQEEKAMAKAKYPHLERHQKEHAKLIGMVAEMSVRFNGSTSPKHAEELMQVMYDWLINHINVVDKEYTEHLNAKGIS
jgi:hemerythrin-like metal-binding protein